MAVSGYVSIGWSSTAWVCSAFSVGVFAKGGEFVWLAFFWELHLSRCRRVGCVLIPALLLFGVVWLRRLPTRERVEADRLRILPITLLFLWSGVGRRNSKHWQALL